jgi:hypothetical protein
MRNYPQVPGPTPGDRTLYTYAEAAPILRRSEKTLRQWVKDGRIPSHLLTEFGHNMVYFTGDQLAEIIDLFAKGPRPAAVARRRRRAA